MNKLVKFFGTVALVALAGFSVIGCENGTIDLGTPDYPRPFNDIIAAELVANITIGWNLGNTLDAHDRREGWLPSDVAGMEKAWSNPLTTRANITAIRNAGFNTIRIPVTWYKVVDSNFNIRRDWMRRVVQIVNFAVEHDMYIILNTHHDEDIFRFTDDRVDASLVAFRRIWEQIADTFKYYDERLIFQALNEPRTIGSSREWQGGTPEEHANLNKYYSVFVDVVRNSGGNNDRRILMINTYAASAEQVAIDALVLPDDPAPNKLIVSIHAYVPFQFAHEGHGTWSASNPSDTSAIINVLNRAVNRFVNNGIPVIMGEFGAVYPLNEAVRAQWAEFYVREANNRGIKCIWWDDGGRFRLLNRRNNTFYFPQIIEALMRGIAPYVMSHVKT